MKFFKYILYLILIVFIYFFIPFLLVLFPLNRDIYRGDGEKYIYLYHDNIHTNIILNIKDTNYNWKEKLSILLKDKRYGFISFGFGDKETYINTPTWNDLDMFLAFKALFINTPAVIHVEYFPFINEKSNHIIKIGVTSRQYKFIEKKILESFGREVHFIHKGYTKRDVFYNSPYKYNLINTCNTWNGDILREANITMSYWTPLSCCVVKSLSYR